MGMKIGREKRPAIQRRRPRQPRAHATVDAVIEASARILREDGLVGLNTNRVSERAGVSIGTLYGYFPNKQAILIAMARRMLAEDRAAVETALNDTAGDPIDAVVHALFQRHAIDPTVRRIVMALHLTEGHGAEHGESLAWFLSLAPRHEQFSSLDVVRLTVVAHAVVGIARALTDEMLSSRDLSVERWESEACELVRRALA